jgi:hypothetical protein
LEKIARGNFSRPWANAGGDYFLEESRAAIPRRGFAACLVA